MAAVINPVGRVVATESFRNDRVGHQQLASWLVEHGPLQRVRVEGTGSYGAGLARQLSRSDLTVIEVNRPNWRRRRCHGKNDTVLVRLARRSQHLNAEITEFDTTQRQLVIATTPGRALLGRPGVVPTPPRPCSAPPVTTPTG